MYYIVQFCSLCFFLCTCCSITNILNVYYLQLCVDQSSRPALDKGSSHQSLMPVKLLMLCVADRGTGSRHPSAGLSAGPDVRCESLDKSTTPQLCADQSSRPALDISPAHQTAKEGMLKLGVRLFIK